MSNRNHIESARPDASNEDQSAARRSWSAFLAEEVTAEWGDLVLVVGCFATGLLDAAIFNVWSCFVSMQTGNTVYVGLGVSGQPYTQPHRWIKSGTSILSFILGSYLFSRLMRALTPLRRSTMILSTLIQAALTFVSAGLSTFGLVPGNAGDLLPDNYIVLLPLSLLAAQAGGQCVLSRILGYGEIPTVVLTSAYCDLAMDEKVFRGVGTNPKRNRRVASMVMIVGGAVLGGFLTKHGEIEVALWVVGGIKVLMAVSWIFWRPREGQIRLP